MSFVVYGKKGCTFCVRAVDLLTSKDYDYKYVDVMEDEASLNKIKAMGCKTVPQIFKEDIHIGGFTELQDYIKENTYVR